MSMDQRLRNLAEKAREAHAPHVNMVDRVMSVIQEPEPIVLILNPWVWTATGSAAAAILVAILSTSWWTMLNDPLMPTVLNIIGALG